MIWIKNGNLLQIFYLGKWILDIEGTADMSSFVTDIRRVPGASNDIARLRSNKSIGNYNCKVIKNFVHPATSTFVLLMQSQIAKSSDLHLWQLINNLLFQLKQWKHFCTFCTMTGWRIPNWSTSNCWRLLISTTFVDFWSTAVSIWNQTWLSKMLLRSCLLLTLQTKQNFLRLHLTSFAETKEIWPKQRLGKIWSRLTQLWLPTFCRTC